MKQIKHAPMGHLKVERFASPHRMMQQEDFCKIV
jgi:hypothetical protein